MICNTHPFSIHTIETVGGCTVHTHPTHPPSRPRYIFIYCRGRGQQNPAQPMAWQRTERGVPFGQEEKLNSASRDRALERQIERERRQRPSSGGGAYYNKYTHMCELFGRTIGHMWITVILEKHTTAALHLKNAYFTLPVRHVRFYESAHLFGYDVSGRC